jgi:acetyl-CoA carboxylase biotin carboxyl carrier protein
VSISWDEALDRVRHIVAACVEGDAERLRVEEEAFSVEVRRTTRRAASLAAPTEYSVAPAGEAPSASSAAASNGAAHPLTEPVLLRADFVGIVRFSRPVVVEGSTVNEDRELAYVESLGTRNPVRAAGSGKIVAVHVIDGQPVDYGHPLFAVVYE